MSEALSVIIPTHNRADLLDEALAGLAEQTWPGDWDVVVVDNNSTDRTSEVVDRWRDRMPVALTRLQANDGVGPSYARNVGVAKTSAPHLAFVDDDDVVGEGWLDAIAAGLATHAMVGSRHEFGHLNPPEVAAANDTGTTALPEVNGTPVVAGSGMACHRSLWDAVGGNDESLRFGEDIDFSLRASDNGIVPVFCPDATYHFRLRSGGRAAYARGRSHGRAAVQLYRRHGRARGERPDQLVLLAKVWAGYLLRLPQLRHPATRLVYLEELGRRVGKLQGSVAERTWYP